MSASSGIRLSVVSLLDNLHSVFSPLILRLLLAYEYWESGIVKFRGENWFADIQNAFPFPFNLIPASVNWPAADCDTPPFDITDWLITNCPPLCANIGKMNIKTVATMARLR